MSALLLALALLAQTASSPAPAPTLPPPMSDARKQRIATLDALLSKRDYLALRNAIESATSREEFKDSLDWERDRTLGGSSAFLDIHYAQDLAALAKSAESKGDDLLGTAGLASLIAIAMIRSDGAHCADQTAVGHRIDQVLGMNPAIWAHLKILPEAQRRELASLIVAYEAGVAARRPPDGDAPFVCRGGMKEMIAGLAAGHVKKVPTPPGGVGTTYEVGTSDALPATVEPAIWKPRQEQARAELPKLLADLLDLKP